MATMLGRTARRHSSCCRVDRLGPDCVDYSKSKRTQRRIELRGWRREADLDLRRDEGGRMSTAP